MFLNDFILYGSSIIGMGVICYVIMNVVMISVYAFAHRNDSVVEEWQCKCCEKWTS